MGKKLVNLTFKFIITNIENINNLFLKTDKILM